MSAEYIEYIKTPVGFLIGFVYEYLFIVGIQSCVTCFFLLKILRLPHQKNYYIVYTLLGYFMKLLWIFYPWSGISEYILSFIYFVFLCLWAKLLLKQNPSTTVFLGLFAASVSALAESIVTPVLSCLVRAFGISETALSNISLIGYLSLTILIFSLYTQFFSLAEINYGKSLWILSAPMLFISLILQAFVALTYSDIFRRAQAKTTVSFTDDMWLFFIDVIAMLSVGTILYAYKHVMLQFKREKEALLLNTQISAQKAYVYELKERYDATKKFRHDLSNHLSVLHGLISENEFDKAGEYLSRFYNAYGDTALPIATGNLTIDILLSEKLRIAKQYDICIKSDIVISEKVPLDDFDLCTIFANALDNAIKGARSAEKDHPTIDITAKPNKGFYIIDIINSFYPGRYEKGEGLGLTAIKMVAMKYGGQVEASAANHEFRLSILLPFE